VQYRQEIEMQCRESVMEKPITTQPGVRQGIGIVRRHVLTIVAAVVVLFLVTYNLTEYPLNWYDEASILHVPKALVRFGVYADYSSEGFRHYGPTVSVGPTVMLPIAGAFWLFGVGLLQARLVMALYLMATIYVFHRLSDVLGGRRFALVVTMLLVASRGPRLLEFGRQVLGEVPALFFVVAGLWLWFAGWEKAGWKRLVVVGLLLGLATVTKYQYLLFLGPTLAASWLLNLVYYRTAPQRTFIIPGLVTGLCFILWLVGLALYMGPETASETLALHRHTAAIAAPGFSPSLIQQNIYDLISFDAYLGALLPALVYGIILALRRRREAHQWGTLLMLVVLSLGWFAFASIGWRRYAFLGLAFASLFVVRMFHDLTDGFRVGRKALSRAEHGSQSAVGRIALRWAMLIWLALMIVSPLGATVWQILTPPFDMTSAMASYLNEHIPTEALIETHEQKMGFLTDHNYHYPPGTVRDQATAHAFFGAPPPEYDFVQTEQPDYVLVGPVSLFEGLYPVEMLKPHYELVTSIGHYQLYALSE
jgi:4-amino-4-deoxy-L-arabinose transferase-like glycosyltransferase